MDIHSYWFIRWRHW